MAHEPVFCPSCDEENPLSPYVYDREEMRQVTNGNFALLRRGN